MLHDKFVFPLTYQHLFSFIGKYLIVSQQGHEIVDLLNPSAKYQVLANNVPRHDWATGGLLQNSPIICGGYKSKDCVVIGQPQLEMKMIEKRAGAASVVLDQSTLWIVGGWNGRVTVNNTIDLNDVHSSTEYIKLGQPSVKGPDLPFTICGHSMIQYDEKSIYIIGGRQTVGFQNGSVRNWSNKTWIVDQTNGMQIKEGPSLNKGRRYHRCAKMTLNGRVILVVAGGYGNNGALDSVEILDPSENNIWTQGLY